MKSAPFGKIWIAVAIIMFVLEGLGHWLVASQMATSAIMPWRGQPDLTAWIIFVAIAIVGGLAFTYVFLQGYRGNGVAEGVRFGLWITLLASVTFNLAALAMLPMDWSLTVEFIVIDLVSFVVAGIAAGALAGSSIKLANQRSAAA